MKNKIKILFHCLDTAGVNYFRIQSPAQELEKNHSDTFHVEINNRINFDDPATMDYLKSFNIIHYHRQLIGDVRKMVMVANELKKHGTKLIVDIDDYWFLHPKHPFYYIAREKKLHEPIIENLKIADYVTTTTELFASEIKGTINKENVGVFYNSINPLWMKQFKDNWKPDSNGLVRITYAGGSSHLGDVEQLEGVINILRTDSQVRDKFKIIVAGWDTEGSTTEINFNQEFGKELQLMGLWNKNLVNTINKCRGNVDLIPNLPVELRERYRGKIFTENKRDIKSEESVYFNYEKILTDNHKIIKNKDYLDWLMNFERNVSYPNEGNFARRWTQKANVYAKVLDETDIVIAPLSDNMFNRMKSPLKQMECWSRKLPIVCSDIPPYNVHGKHMENCVLIPNKNNARKYWAKYLKKLILDEELRKKLGNQMYEDFKEDYHLTNVTKKRAEFYEKIFNE